MLFMFPSTDLTLLSSIKATWFLLVKYLFDISVLSTVIYCIQSANLK